ncbi:sugar ABC transporter ATP-binding protein [Clostridium sp. DL1XJH146]
MKDNILLRAEKIVKSYSGNVVLSDVDFEVKAGEVHALVGENGAGKSTLIKVITGFVERDSGEFYYNGEDIKIKHTRNDAQDMGISAIYQELSSIPSLTVAQNIFLGREPLNKFTKTINKKEMYKRANELIQKYKFDIKADTKVESLSIAKRQLVEILKALSLKASLLIMDEPTASLSASESEILFKIIADLKKEGVSIVYISHRMEEVFALADRVTVLRDGKKVALLEKDQIDPEEIIKLMIGRNIEEQECHSMLKKIDGDSVLKVEKLTSVKGFQNISFNLKKGEILGISGLVGSGRTELARAIFGADKYNSGNIYLNGEKYKPTIKKSIANGIGFVPEERRNQGIVPEISVQRNIAICNFEKISDNNVVSFVKENKLAREAIEIMNIKPNNTEIHVGNLSGGNAQKVVLGKWLVRDLNILIVDEPTAGVDIGAKEEIYTLIEKIAAKGVGVIVITSDLPELTRLSNRILIMREGKLIKEFSEGSIDEETVLKASQGLMVSGGSSDEKTE